MKHFQMLDISFFQIQLFLAVAERESVTQASRHLNITQSAVSKNIKYLEDTLGLYLFRREKQTLHLTPAGRLLKEEFTVIYDSTQKALEKAHVLQSGGEKPVVIGIPETSNLTKFFLNVKRHLREKNIKTSLHIECLSFQLLEKQLLSGIVDIVITCGFDLGSYTHPELMHISFPSGPYYAYMLPENPLAGKHSITMKDLQTSAFLLASQVDNPTYEQLVLNMCQQAGFRPLISKHVHSQSAFICNFDEGNEVFIADSYMRESENSSLKRIPIEGTASSIAIIRRRKNQSPVIPYIYDEIISAWPELS